MSLVEAFRKVGPLIRDDQAESAIRSEAAEVLLPVLKETARKVRGFPDGVLDDAVGMLCGYLLRHGPRGVRPHEPDDEAGLRRLLYTALKRHALSIMRSKPRSQGDASRLIDEPLDSPEVTKKLVDRSRQQALEEAFDVGPEEYSLARAQLLDEIVPAVADRRPSREFRELFVQNIRELDDVSRGQRTFREILAEHLTLHSEKPERQVADMLYQRYKNTRAALIKELKVRSDQVERKRLIALVEVVAGLRLD